ncbi:MAG: hypothetical protein MUO76_15010 [Anaerolineaceae bacterium]|nr:hypothetical protein [Anaerolineaceae bacterium]
MSSDELGDAIALSRAGKKTDARILLKQIVANDPHNETAWIWFADSFSKTTSKIKAIELWLRIDPENETARKALVRLHQFLGEESPQQVDQEEQYQKDTRQAFMPKSKRKENAARSRVVVIISLVSIPLIVLCISAFGLISREFGYNLIPKEFSFEPDCMCEEVEGYLNRVLDRVERWKTNRALYEFASMLGEAPSDLTFAHQLYEEEVNDTVPKCMDEAHITFLALLDLHLKYAEALQVGEGDKASYYSVAEEYKQGELQLVFAEIQQGYNCDP